MDKIKVLALNISGEKGTIKKPVKSIVVNSLGIVGDAHSGKWHRQISMLASESINKFESVLGRKIKTGEFAENITTQGINLSKVSILDKFKIGNVLLEVTQIGKKCHGDSCQIFQQVGKCIMPKEGIFCRVLQGGVIKPNDAIQYTEKKILAAIITLSDRANNGIYKDLSGPAIAASLKKHYQDNRKILDIETTILPDDKSEIKKNINKYINKNYDIIITTGGTGIGPRDITVDVLKPILNKEIPGIMDFIRMKYGKKLPNALISRSIAGTINKTLVFALPGSLKAVKEYMNEILKVLDHLFLMINNIDFHSSPTE